MTRRRSSFVVAGGLAAGLAGCVALACFRHWALAELVVTAAWGIAVLGSFAGWGHVVERVAGDRAPIALRAVWGASLLAFVGGALASASLLGRGVLFAMVGAGIAIQLYRWSTQERDALTRVVSIRYRAARLYPGVACAALFVACAVAVHYLGGAADFSSNPYDDDVAYHTFTKLLVQRGTLIDPFSFRRMSTLGGQSFFQALLFLRVPILHTNVFDRGMCVLLAAGLVASQRVGGRRPPTFARLLAIVFFVALPYTGINTASYYSGLVWFLALYQSVERLPDVPVRTIAEGARRALPLALTAAAACTLRQNYQTQVAFFVLVSYAFMLWRRRRNARLRTLLLEPIACVALVAAFVIPWLVLSYRSNATFLFPIMSGTLRRAIRVQSPLMTTGKLIRFFVEVWLSPTPLTTLPMFVLVGLLIHEKSSRAPLASQWIASFVSIAALAVGFSMSDPGNLARYDYGFVLAGALATWLVAASRATRSRAGIRGAVPAAVLGACMVLTMDKNTRDSQKMFDHLLRDTSELLRRSAPPQDSSPVADTYRRLQAAVPAGAKLLVMLDQPYYLDFSRNEVLNLDMPGLASPAPGIPCFRGPEPVAEYLGRLGIRYLAFVEAEHSTYLYRHDIWFEHLYDQEALWRVIAPYMVDVMDNVAELAKTRAHLFDEAGMVVLDLQARR